MIRRSLGLTAAALALGFSMSMTAYAATSDLQLTLDENGSFYYSTDNKISNGKISLGDMFQGIAPGETRTATTTLTNDCAYADFYISTQTLDTFEDNGKSGGATNGYYDIQLSVTRDGTTTYVYDSTLGGYTGNQTNSAYGLLEMNDNLDSYVFLTTLNEDESAIVTFSITLDGETVGNSYSAKDAVIDFDYQAVYKAKNVVTLTGNAQVNTVDRKNTEYVTATTTILDEDVALAGVPSGVSAAKTGDTFEIYVYSVLLVLALIVFGLTFKKNKKNKTVILFAMLLAGSVSISARADSAEYLITYRVGGMGTFETDSYSLPVDQYTIVEKNAYYVTIKVKSGSKYPACPDVVVSDDMYEVNNEWLNQYDGNDGIVQANEELVVDYTRLTNPTRYTVTYQTKDGTILGRKNGNGNIDETIELAKIFTGYRVESSVTSLTLSSDSTKNTLVIEYVEDTALTTGVEYQYLPGPTSTVYHDVTETVYLPGTVGVSGSSTTGGMLILTPGTSLGLDFGGTAFSVTQNNTQNAGLGGGNAAVFNPENMIAEDLEDNPQNNVEINEQEVPLDQNVDNEKIDVDLNETIESGAVNQNNNNVIIEDEMTPVTDAIGSDGDIYPIIISVSIVILAIGITAFVFSIRQKRKISN